MTADPARELEQDAVTGRVLRAVAASRNLEAAARRRANRQRSLFADDDDAPATLHDAAPLERWRRGAELRLTQCMVAGCEATEALEQHHTFPTWVAGPEVADVWPIVTLCRAHHRLWHVCVDKTA